MNTKKAKELKKDLKEDVGVDISTNHLKKFLNSEDKIKKKKCIKFQLIGSGNFLVLEMNEFNSVVDYFEIGDKYEVEIFEMPEKEFLELPDFDGF